MRHRDPHDHPPAKRRLLIYHEMEMPGKGPTYDPLQELSTYDFLESSIMIMILASKRRDQFAI